MNISKISQLNIEEQLNDIILQSSFVDNNNQKVNYKLSDFNDLINSSFINWNCEKADYLIGSCLIRVPPVKIPVLPESSLPVLKAYRHYLTKTLAPLRTSPDQIRLFNNLILLLINCYPTYCKKDEGFKKQTISSFLTFLEDYSLVALTKTIQDWIREEKEYPTIADLRIKAKNITLRIELKLQRVERLIEAIK